MFVHVRTSFTGDAAAGQTMIQPLRALGPFLDTVHEMPYSQIDSVHMDPTEPSPAWVRSILANPLDETAAEKIATFVGDGSGLPPGAIEIRHLGGQLTREPVPIAVGHRSAAMFVFYGIHSPDFAPAKSAGDRFFSEMSPYDTGGIFINFLGYNETNAAGTAKAYDSGEYRRLQRVKKRVDPSNRLRVNYNIPPA